MHQHGCAAQVCYLSVVSSRQRGIPLAKSIKVIDIDKNCDCHSEMAHENAFDKFAVSCSRVSCTVVVFHWNKRDEKYGKIAGSPRIGFL